MLMMVIWFLTNISGVALLHNQIITSILLFDIKCSVIEQLKKKTCVYLENGIFIYLS